MSDDMKKDIEAYTGEHKEEVTKRHKGVWSIEEHDRYLQAILLYEAQKCIIPEKWKFIQAIVTTRSVEQCRSHHQKHELKVKQLESKRQRQQQHYYGANERAQFMQPPRGYQMQSYCHPYQLVYTPHQHGPQEEVLMTPYYQQHGLPPRYWLQIPPPPPPQYYYTSPPPRPHQQRAQLSIAPTSAPNPDSSLAPPQSRNENK